MTEEAYDKFLKLCQNSIPEIETAFPVLFLTKLNPLQVILVFFQAIASNFKVLKTLPSKKFQKNSGLDFSKNEDKRIYFFWKYLTGKVWPVLENKYENLTNNIFGFALGFPINETKVVILAEDPSPINNIGSSGYAYHGTVCDSTTALLNYVETEMGLANQFAEHFNLSRPNENGLSFEERKKDANLRAWIDQRVLLINTMLTEKDTVWKYFTNFLMDYLNEHGSKIVFILMGNVAKSIADGISNPDHKVITVEHPNAENRRKTSKNLSEYWDDRNTFKKNLPFLKAAYHKFLKTGEIIDWLAIANYGEAEDTRDERRNRFLKLFQSMQRANGYTMANKELRVALNIINN